MEKVSKKLFVAQVFISGLQTYEVFNSNASLKTKMQRTAKSATDVTIAYISLTGGPAGWIAGGLYFIGDVTGINSWISNQFGISNEQSKQYWQEINNGTRPCKLCDR